MAYQNISFPVPKLKTGIKKTFIKPTIIVGNGYTEYRIQRQQNIRSRWTIPGKAMLTVNSDIIINFIKSVNIGLDSFNFVCPKDGTTYKVRFDGAEIGISIDAIDWSNASIAESIPDIALIQVYGE
jgi:hypothetical protein